MEKGKMKTKLMRVTGVGQSMEASDLIYWRTFKYKKGDVIEQTIKVDIEDLEFPRDEDVEDRHRLFNGCLAGVERWEDEDFEYVKVYLELDRYIRLVAQSFLMSGCRCVEKANVFAREADKMYEKRDEPIPDRRTSDLIRTRWISYFRSICEDIQKAFEFFFKVKMYRKEMNRFFVKEIFKKDEVTATVDDLMCVERKIEKKMRDCSHDLRKSFNKLSSSDQDDLRKEFERIRGDDKYDFDEMLGKIKEWQWAVAPYPLSSDKYDEKDWSATRKEGDEQAVRECLKMVQYLQRKLFDEFKDQ